MDTTPDHAGPSSPNSADQVMQTSVIDGGGGRRPAYLPSPCYGI